MPDFDVIAKREAFIYATLFYGTHRLPTMASIDECQRAGRDMAMQICIDWYRQEADKNALQMLSM
jgi:hypothetical protein